MIKNDVAANLELAVIGAIIPIALGGAEIAARSLLGMSPPSYPVLSVISMGLISGGGGLFGACAYMTQDYDVGHSFMSLAYGSLGGAALLYSGMDYMI